MADNQFMSAIDNHNVANGDESWFSKKADSTSEFIGDVGEAVTKGSVGAVVAGVNSFINTGIAVANFVGADFEPVSTYDTLKSLDDNLGEYYKIHESGIETAGFLLSSFIPGLAGIKALQAAKAGVLGKNMEASSGLMISLTRDYAKAARIEFASGNSPFSILNANTVKALAQGLGSSSLDMLAFETAVTATMYKSPVLDGESAGDILSDIMVGTLIGGGIGGILHGTKLGYGIIKAGKAVDIELFPYKHIEVPPATTTPDIKIINLFEQKMKMPEPELSPTYTGDLDPAARIKLISEAREKTISRLDVLIRTELTNMAHGDARIGQQLFDVLDKTTQLPTFSPSQQFGDLAASLIHTRELNRITQAESLQFGDVIFPQHKMGKEMFEGIVTSGKFSNLFVPSATKETQGYRAIGDVNKLQIASYGKDIGSREDAFAKNYDVFRNANGTFSVNPESKILQKSEFRRLSNNRIIDFEQDGAVVDKATAGLADFATKDNPITVHGDTVLAGNINPIKVGDTFKYDPTKVSHIEAQARTIWAQEQKNIYWKDKVIG